MPPLTLLEPQPLEQPRRSPAASSSLGTLGAVGALGVLLLLSSCAGELEGDPTRFNNAFGIPGGGATGSGGAPGAGTAGTVSGGGMAAAGAPPGAGGAPAPGTGGMGGGVAPNIPPDDPCVAMVVQSNCLTCHSKAGSQTFNVDLVLEGAELGKRLSSTQATYKSVGAMRSPEKCVKPNLIIDPVTPANSLLLKKVSGKQECGDPMPFAPGLTGENLTCIQNWINKFGR